MLSVHIPRQRRLLLACALVLLGSADLPIAQAQQAREPLPPVEVSPPESRKQAKPTGRDRQGPRRTAARRPAVAAAAPKPLVPAAPMPTPLNSNAVAESVSRLGLTVRTQFVAAAAPRPTDADLCPSASSIACTPKTFVVDEMKRCRHRQLVYL